MAEKQKDLAALKLAAAVVEGVAAAGNMGIAGGPLYAMLMSYGFSLSQFMQLMGTLVQVGAVTKSGEIYTVTDAGHKLIAAVA